MGDVQAITPPISGVRVHPLKRIADSRGAVMHMMRADSPPFERFGEVYFSLIHTGVVKAWKKHLQVTQNLAVPVGKVRVVIYDDRAGSPSLGRGWSLDLGPDNYVLLSVPPHLWYGFVGMADGASLIANCTDVPFDESQVMRADAHDPRFLSVLGPI